MPLYYWNLPEIFLIPSVENIHFQKLYPLEFHQNFHHPPGIFHCFLFFSSPGISFKILTTPWNFPCLFPSTPWNFQNSNPLEFNCPQQNFSGKLSYLVIIQNTIHYSFRSVLSYHYYEPPDFSKTLNFHARMADLKRLKCGGFLTETYTVGKDFKGMNDII